MAKETTTLKKKKKNWYTIVAPKVLNNVSLGETYVYNKENIIGKTMKLNLSTFTNDMRRQNLDVKFQIIAFADNKATTTITGLALTQSYMKRLVRRGRDKVDDSFLVKSKDGKVIRVKPLMVTNSRTSMSVNSRIRLEARKILARYVNSKNYEDFFHDVMMIKLQKEMKEALSKIYPLKQFEIRQALLAKKTKQRLSEVVETDEKKKPTEKKSSKTNSEDKVEENQEEKPEFEEKTEKSDDSEEESEEKEE